MSEIKDVMASPVLVNQAVTGVWGLAVRTSNHAEQDVETQKIAPLWQQLMSRSEVQSNTSSPMYGCYYGYESNHNGEFSVLAGLAAGVSKVVDDGSHLNGLGETNELTELTLAAGKYLCFSAKGEVPGIVISLWGQIWQYFEASHCQFERSYNTDYECYTSMDGVDIYIGVKQRK